VLLPKNLFILFVLFHGYWISNCQFDRYSSMKCFKSMTAFYCMHGVIYYYLVDILSLLMRSGVVEPNLGPDGRNSAVFDIQAHCLAQLPIHPNISYTLVFLKNL
jgi:hypothetical protein